MDMKMY